MSSATPGFDGALSTEATRLGRMVWAAEGVARALGAVLGRSADGASASEPDDVEVVDLARRIRRQVGTAGVLRARLPELREFPVDALVVGDGLPGWAGLLADMESGAPSRALELDGIAAAALARALEEAARVASPVGSPTFRRCAPRLVEELRSGGPGPTPPAPDDLAAELLGP